MREGWTYFSTLITIWVSGYVVKNNLESLGVWPISGRGCGLTFAGLVTTCAGRASEQLEKQIPRCARDDRCSVPRDELPGGKGFLSSPP